MEFTFPTSAELSLIERDKLAVLTMDDPIFDLFPIENSDAAKVMWEQKDNFTGLMSIRGLNGSPGHVAAKGMRRFEMNPGRYGSFALIEEGDLELRRQLGTLGQPISLDELVGDRQDQLLDRRINRMRWILWTLVTTGTFSVASDDGGIVHTDTYPFQTQTALVAWSSLTTATPLKDLRSLKLKARGHSVRFDRAGKMYMNLNTANYLLNNSNAADIGGKRVEMGATFNTIDDLNKLLAAADLPSVEIHDEGYLNDSGTFVPWIADDVVVVIGKRTTGEPIGKFKLTRNASNPDMAPGPYTYVTDSLDTGVKIPRNIRVDDGFNGGPTMEFPSAVVILDTTP